MTSVSQDARAGGDRGHRLGASDPWAARLERMAAALAYRKTGDPFVGRTAAGAAPIVEFGQPPAGNTPGGRRLMAAIGLVFTRFRLG